MWLGLGLGLWLWARERERERGCGCVWGYVAVAVAAAVGEEDGERAAPVGRRGKAGRGNGTERTDSRLPRYSQPVRGYVRSICTGGIPSRGIAVSCFGSCMGGCGGGGGLRRVVGSRGRTGIHAYTRAYYSIHTTYSSTS